MLVRARRKASQLVQGIARASSMLLLVACSCEPPPVQTDAGTDAGAVDAAAFVDWHPAFSPRLLYQREIDCPPVNMPSFEAGRPPVDSGTVRWVYAPMEDPRFVERAASLWLRAASFRWNHLTFTADGGVVAVVDDLFELGLDAEGAFKWLERSVRQRRDRMWLPPDRTLVIGSGTLTDSSHAIGARRVDHIPRLTVGMVREDSYPVPIPDDNQITSERVIGGSPALMEDGSIVWAVTSSALIIACVQTGEVRAVIEHDPPPERVSLQAPGLYATSTGGFVFAWHALYRFASSGDLLAESISETNGAPGFGVTPMGYSDSCGLALAYSDRVEWRDPMTLGARGSLPIAELGNYVTPTADCGVIEYLTSERRLRRTGQSGTRLFDVVEPGDTDAGLRELWAVEGGVLMLYSTPPHAIVVGDDGSVLSEVRLDRATYGDVGQYNAGLMPDGVLAFVTVQSDQERLVAVQTDARPTYPRFRFLGQSGLDWAHTGGTWLTD